MLKVTYKLKLGQDEFELTAEVKDEKDFFETLSFYSSLPKTAPGGSDDLKISFRTTKKGHKYYSLVSEKEKKEFKFGQNLDTNGGGLFPKSWSDLFGQDDDETQESTVQVPTFGKAQPGQLIPTAAKAAPAFNPSAAGFTAPQTTKAAAPVLTVPVTKVAVPEAAAPAANPSVAAVADNVLARFGINKK